MKHHPKGGYQFLPVRTIGLMTFILTLVAMANSAFVMQDRFAADQSLQDKTRDSIVSVAAFDEVYKVLMHPRCMNCHPKGDTPLQGDDSHLHTMLPTRGKDGHGVYAMKCSNCHQPQNTPGPNTPPGNPKWALPPANMKMVFEGKKPRELALQIMDYKRNGNKDKAKLLEHARDTLVKAGWNMGEGRVPPPVAYADFVKAWDTWIKKGGYAPKQ